MIKKRNKLKTTVIILSSAVFLASCVDFQKKREDKKEGYLIEGDIEGRNSGMVYLQAQEKSQRIIDSVPLTNGKFFFEGRVEEPMRYTVRIDTTNGAVAFLLSNEPVKIQAHIDSLYGAKVQGGTAHSIYRSFYTNEFGDIRKKAGEIYELSDSLTQGGEIGLSEEQTALIDVKWEKINDYAFEKTASFIEENSNSIAAAMVIEDRYIQYPEPEKASLLFDKLSPEAKSSYYGRKVKRALDAYERTSIGKIAPDFEMPDPQGNPIKLSDFRGKYVLLDFWASWCGPCRKENPNLVKAYKKYSDQNFEILGVSLDSEEDRDKWLTAIDEDGLLWSQVSDLKGFETKVSEEYVINSIPQSFLLNPEGVIVAKNLRGEELQERLREIFAEQ